jgi:hypothetical protein
MQQPPGGWGNGGQPPGWGGPRGYPPPQGYPPQGYGPPPGYGPPGYGPPPPNWGQPPPQPPKWYQQLPVVFAAIFCCFPLGLGLLWGSPAIPPSTKKGLTAAVCVLLFLGMIGGAQSRKGHSGAVETASSNSAVLPGPVARSRGPDELCRLMEPHGMRTSRGWIHQINDEWGFATSQVVVSGTKPFENGVVFVGNGTRNRVGDLVLKLYVNDPETANDAQRALATFAGTLISGALGSSVPGDLTSAILAGRPGAWSLAGHKVTLERNVWPTGKGYDLRLVVLM